MKQGSEKAPAMSKRAVSRGSIAEALWCGIASLAFAVTIAVAVPLFAFCALFNAVSNFFTALSGAWQRNVALWRYRVGLDDTTLADSSKARANHVQERGAPAGRGRFEPWLN